MWLAKVTNGLGFAMLCLSASILTLSYKSLMASYKAGDWLNSTDLGIPVVALPILVGIAAAFGAAVVWFNVWNWRRDQRCRLHSLYAESASKGHLLHHTIQLTPEGIFETTPTNESLFKWGSIGRIDTFDGYCAIYVDVTRALVIPEKGVEAGNFQSFVNAVREAMTMVTHGQSEIA
jgi:hypothetical protein